MVEVPKVDYLMVVIAGGLVGLAASRDHFKRQEAGSHSNEASFDPLFARVWS